MSAATSQIAILIFAIVAVASLLAGLLWERHEQRRQWRHALQRLGSGRRAAEMSQPRVAVVLRASAPEHSGASLHWLPFAPRAQALIEQAAMAWTPRGWLIRSACCGVAGGLLALVLLRSVPAMFIGCAAAGAVPWMRLRRARALRLARFEAAFPDVVDLLSRAIRAGHPLTAGLRMVAEEAPSPVREEFQRVFDEQKFGLGMHDSLDGLARRIDLLDVRIFATAVNIQREVGGNLAEILDGIAETIRERFKIVRQVRTFTAQGRMTGLLLGALPIALGLLLALINPAYMAVLIDEPGGRVLLAGAAGLQLIGFWFVRRVTRIEV